MRMIGLVARMDGLVARIVLWVDEDGKYHEGAYYSLLERAAWKGLQGEPP
jgi:hypothetical protein